MNNPDKMKFETPNLTANNMAKLEELFPGVVADGKVNVDLLRSYVGEEIFGDEAYEFTWAGKRAAFAEASRPIRKTLRPVVEDEITPTGEDSMGDPYCSSGSRDWDTTENLYIEGDNLDVLKLLQESYLGKVNMIYIDPPYNTGGDFIYRDDFTQSREEYYEEVGMYDEEGGCLFKNTETNGRFHSDWCSMIYARLLAARALLADDGVIAISIGYQEMNNLTAICQELFSNRQIMPVTVQTSGGKPNGGFNISHEYIVFVVPKEYEPIPAEEDMKEYSSPYHGMNLATFNQIQRPNQAYPIYVDSKERIVGCGKSIQERIDDGSFTGHPGDFIYDFDESPKGCVAIWPVTSKGEQCVWRLIPSRLMGDWKKGYIKVVQSNDNTKNKYGIQYLSGGIISKIESGELESFRISNDDSIPTIDVKGYKTAGAGISTIWTDKQYYTTKGSNQIREIFEQKCFTYPKPLELIYYILKRTTNKDSLVVDFFSGSATTAHAVMQLNAEDGGNRKFIMVQLPELSAEGSDAAKAGYKTICEIGKERIRRAGNKLCERVEVKNPPHRVTTWTDDDGSQMQLEESTITEHFTSADYPPCDIGFRVLKLADTNMNDVYYAAGDYTQDMIMMMQSNIKEDRTDMDLLFGCLLDWGLPLSLPHTHEKIDGFTAHTYNGGDLIACFDERISEKAVREIASRKPLRAVFRDSSFTSSPEKINVFEIFKLLAPNTTVKVI